MKRILSIIAMATAVSTVAQTELINDNFDDGNISGWTENIPSAWEASATSPLNGTSSLKHKTGTSQPYFIYQQLSTNPTKGNMVWEWTQQASYNPSLNSGFWFYLMTDKTDFTTANGYAVGVNMASAFDDVLKFYKTTNGTTESFTEVLNFGDSNTLTSGDTWSIKVERNSVGKWTFYLDKTGTQSSYSKIGETVENSYTTNTPYSGVYLNNNSTSNGNLKFDDIKVTTTEGEATPTINLEVFDANVREGQKITINAMATSAVTGDKTVSLNFAGTAGTSDYSSLASTITIPSGTTKGSVEVTITADSEFEATESLNLTLGLNGQSGIAIGNGVNLSISDDIRIMNANLLRYPDCKAPGDDIGGCNAVIKNGYLKTILGYIQPDIFGVNEMDADEANGTLLLDGALNVDGVTKWKKAAYDHPTASPISNMLFYNSEKFTLFSQEAITVSGQRETNLYTLYLNSPELATTKDTIFLHMVQSHLKAGACVFGPPGGDPQNCLDRDEIAQAIMERINAKVSADGRRNYIIMGDFNLYSPTELAYQTLTNYTTNPAINFVDPLNATGEWSGNKDFAFTHTQATRVSSTALGDNGGSGGMDDRFDFILASNNIITGADSIEYINGTYSAYGNDGNRFQKDLNTVYSSTVPQDVMDAMYFNSDHTPVIADFKLKFKNEVTKFTADATEICGGATSIQFTDQSNNAPNGWTWDFGDGTTSTSQNPTHIYTTAGKYTVTLTVNKTAGGTDAATIIDYITVYDEPSTAVAGTDISTCNLITATLAATIPTVGMGSWSVVSGAGTITNPTDFGTTVTGLELDKETTLKWSVSNGTCTPTTDTVKINAHSNPDATITNNKTVCISDVLKLTSATSGGTWSGTAVNPTTEEFNATTAGEGVFKIDYTVTDANNCTSNSSANITVRSTFDPTITTTTTTILSSDPAITFTATDDGGTWGGTPAIDAITGVFDPAKATEGDNVVTYTFTGSCAASASHTIAVFNGQGFDDFTDGNFTASPAWSGNTASYTVNAQKELQINATDAGTYYLSAPNTIIDDAVWQFNFKFDGTTSGSNMAEVYLVSDVADLSGSLNGYHVRIGNTNDEVVLMRKKGTSNSTLINGTDKLIDTDPVNITIKVTRSKAGDWELFVDPAGGTNFISQGTANDLTFTSTKYFGVATEVTKTNITKVSYDNFVINGTPGPINSVNEENVLESSIYPNPSNGNITINVKENGVKTVTVYNTLGEVVATLQSSNNSIILNLENLANGIYSLVVSTNNKTSSTKITIAK
jgi:PKD repeat protein